MESGGLIVFDLRSVVRTLIQVLLWANFGFFFGGSGGERGDGRLSIEICHFWVWLS